MLCELTGKRFRLGSRLQREATGACYRLEKVGRTSYELVKAVKVQLGAHPKKNGAAIV